MSQVWNARRVGAAILLIVGAALAIFPGGCSLYFMSGVVWRALGLAGRPLPEDNWATEFAVVSLIGLLVAALGIWLARRAWRSLQKGD